jgi:hypothetical protein
MANMILSFRAKVEHGCLVVRAVEAEDDLTDWDPRVENWYKSGSSMIFGVLPAAEGPIEVEVWDQIPAQALPIELFSDVISPKSGILVIHDPNEDVQMRFRSAVGNARLSALVDDATFPSRVQLIVEK